MPKTALGELIHVNLPTIFVVVFFNSFSVALMNKSDFGMSALSALPFVFSKVFPILSFGSWNVVIQILLILILSFLCKKFSISYFFSFFLAFGYSEMLNVYEVLLSVLPDSFYFHILYFVISFACMCFGINIANNGYIPILPTDLFPRNISIVFQIPYAKVKTIFDLSFLSGALIMCILFLQHFHGIGLGVGTIICAFCTGKTVSLFHHFIPRNVALPKFHTSSSNFE